MSEEELNQELSTDELKDVSGGFKQQMYAFRKEKSSKSLGSSGDDGVSTDDDVSLKSSHVRY